MALLLFTAPARAQDGEPATVPFGTVIDRSDRAEAVADMRRQLESDQGLQEALVERIMKSKIADAISKETDQGKKSADVRAWVVGDLGSASEVALGLNQDDSQGTHLFENTLVKQLVQTFRRNPNAEKGAYGVLKGAAKQSKIIDTAEQDVSEEQRREALRSLFEGKGTQGARVITGQAPSSAEQLPSMVLTGSFYDRLSAGNIRGYSPQLMALQSALNTRRPPGAPQLIETGKLDFATLSYPAYGLRYDLGNLEERLRRARLAQLANLAGVRLTPSDMVDPNLEARLLGNLADVQAGDKLSKRFASRAVLLVKAKTALTAFETAALRSKDPSDISRALLVELAGRQREAARWITAAALEEALGHVEAEEGFLTAELLIAIDAVPAPAPARESYKRRGKQYQTRLAQLKVNAQRALAALLTDVWLSRLGEIEKMMGDNAALRRNLSRNISDYRLVPHRIGESLNRQARWREWIDNLLVKYAAPTSYGRAVASRREKLSRYLVIFGLIASGDLETAHISLVNAEARSAPSRGRPGSEP